jgi:hypothetical protein
MSEVSRRAALQRIAFALAAAGTVDSASAREVHQIAGDAASPAYSPGTFTPHEYQTLERLVDFIIPVEDGAPGAVAAGCAQWIDTISGGNEALTGIYRRGLAWLDAAMKQRGAADVASAPAADVTALLDLIAYRRNASAEITPGIEFFAWARRMTVDAFYTSDIGIKDIDYRGNTALAAYPSPDDAIAYALKRVNL